MIEVNNLYKKYNKKGFAVEDVSFRVNEGEVVGLLGENGAGKTTTLRILATMLKSSKGSASINGFDVRKNSQQVRNSIGILFGGDVALYDRLTARENIAYFGELYDMDKADIEKRIETLSKQFGFDYYLDKKASELSRGMKQKISIARSIIHDPKVILLDEPTTGLDIVARRSLYDLIAMLANEQGKTILFSSHSINEIERLCKRVIIINKGKLVEEGTDAELRAKYNKDTLEDVFIELVTGGAYDETDK